MEALKLMSQLLVCSKHPENPVKLYCELHDDFVCGVCVAIRHRNCASVIEIKDVPKQSTQNDSKSLVKCAEKMIEHS